MDIIAKYDRTAPRWSAKIEQLGYPEAYANFLRQDLVQSGAVLDLGTGTGALARAWIDVGGSQTLTLLDVSAAMLKQAREGFRSVGISPGIIYSRFEDFRPPQKYDVILAAHFLEHCKDPTEAMGRIADLLRPKGRLCLVVSKPHWCNWLLWLRFRHRWFSPESICCMARTAGLSHVRTHRFSAGPPSRTSLGYIFARL